MKSFKADFYNESYFLGKTNFCGIPYEWECEKERTFERVDEVIKFYRPTSVLELGCALGFTMRALRERGVKALGCDISEHAFSQNQYKDDIKICDIRDGLPYEDECVDVIISESTLEHIDIEYIPKLMSEIYRVAMSGFFLMVPITLGTKNKPWGDPSHVTYMNPSYWISEAYKAGWSVDIRRSEMVCKGIFQNVHLAFFKGSLYAV